MTDRPNGLRQTAILALALLLLLVATRDGYQPVRHRERQRSTLYVPPPSALVSPESPPLYVPLARDGVSGQFSALVASARRGPPLECDLVTIEEASRLRDPPLLNLPGRPIQHIRGGALAQTWLEGRLPSIHWLASAAHVLSFRLATAAPEPEMVKTRLLMATVLGRMARERAAHPETLGERLLSLRKLAGYTQVDLAYRTRVSLTALRDWEHGRATPRPAHVAALCRVLKCRRGDLLG